MLFRSLEKTCNSAHEQTPLSNDTIDSVLGHREVGRAKDLSAPLYSTNKEANHLALSNPDIRFFEGPSPDREE